MMFLRYAHCYFVISPPTVFQDAQRLIAREYSRCAMIAHISRPRNRELKGWGKPGTPYEGIQFRRGILDTVNVLGQCTPCRIQ